MKNFINVPESLSDAEKVEYLKVAAEFWKTYLSDLETFEKKCKGKSGRISPAS